MAGVLKQEGDAIDVVAPDATALTFGELYRIDKWSGFAMRSVAAADTERGLALEVSNRIWYCLVPSGMTAARGDLLYWSSGTGFKTGVTDLVVSGTGGAVGPVAKVEEAKDGNNYAGLRVLNNAS